MPFIFLGLSVFSLWVRRDIIIWGTLLLISLVMAYMGGLVDLIGISALAAWALLCFSYQKKNIFLFLALIVLSFAFKFHLIPGFKTIAITPKFLLGIDVPVMELIPMALFVPLARSIKDWKLVLRGIAYGVIGVAILAGLAVIAKAAHWQFKLPSHALLRYGVNFTFTAILEEGFYRGFIQSQLTNYLKGRKYLALVIASVIFTFAHVYWSPSVAIMAFVFLASLIYGGVFLISGKVESAIVTHFLLNFIHMTFFSYHAM